MFKSKYLYCQSTYHKTIDLNLFVYKNTYRVSLTSLNKKDFVTSLCFSAIADLFFWFKSVFKKNS